MAHHKGTTLVLVRKMLQAQGPEFEKKVLDQLDEGERQDYLNAKVVFWYPVYDTIDDNKALLAVAAQALFPEDPAPLRRFGKVAANFAINGLYKILFRVPSLTVLMRHAPMLWRTYNDTGAFYVEDLQQEQQALSVRFVVKNHPGLPLSVREFLAGYYAAVLEWTGAKKVEVTLNQTYTDEGGWRWDIQAEY